MPNYQTFAQQGNYRGGNAPSVPLPIPSPYNFVPLSRQVMVPDPKWADQAMHDIPFSDGISGSLTIEVTAETPIYTRNGGKWPERTQERNNLLDYQSFFKLPSGEFALPGTALKGVIRNIVEIASFGKIRRVSDHRYGFRDLYNSEYTSQITEQRSGAFYTNAKAGWLQKSGDGWQIIPCDFGRIEQSVLDGDDMTFGTSRCNAIEKYGLWAKWGNPLTVKCHVAPMAAHHRSCGNLMFREVTKGGNTEGTLVFTGQPMPRTGQPKRKHMEFFFFNKGAAFKVPDSVCKDFVFIHSDDKGEPNPEWKFWQEKAKKWRENVPVFYLEDDAGSIKSMGLAMMYRLPYKHGIHAMVRHTSEKHLEKEPDLADIIFGHCHDTDNSLRGRVQFGLFVADPATVKPWKATPISTVLGSPKPTFYPNYVKQDISDTGTGRIKGVFKTYNHDKAELRGWKRYYPRPMQSAPDISPSPSLDVETRFIPLAPGSRFIGCIRVHNLRPVELGALVWALTWGGNKKLRHSIGMAKPLGFGTVKITINSCDLTNTSNTSVSIEEARTEFERFMEDKIPSWKSTDDIIPSLLALAMPKSNDDGSLDYPVLTTKPQRNDFAKYKDPKAPAALLPTTMSVKSADASKDSKLHAGNPGNNSESKKAGRDSQNPWESLFQVLKRNPNESVNALIRLIDKCCEGTQEQIDRLTACLEKRMDWKYSSTDPLRKRILMIKSVEVKNG